MKSVCRLMVEREGARHVGLVLRGAGDQDVGEHGKHAAVAGVALGSRCAADAKAHLESAFVPAREEQAVVGGEGAARRAGTKPSGTARRRRWVGRSSAQLPADALPFLGQRGPVRQVGDGDERLRARVSGLSRSSATPCSVTTASANQRGGVVKAFASAPARCGWPHRASRCWARTDPAGGRRAEPAPGGETGSPPAPACSTPPARSALTWRRGPPPPRR